MADITQPPTKAEISDLIYALTALGADSPFVTTLRRMAFQLDQIDEPLPVEQIYGGTPRSSRWPKVSDMFLEDRSCTVCGGKEKLVAHHILPYHLYPDLELEPSNLMPLCQSGKYGINCHLWFGHLGNWRRYNESACADAALWYRKRRDQ